MVRLSAEWIGRLNSWCRVAQAGVVDAESALVFPPGQQAVPIASAAVAEALVV
jgi:hypothetical protein